MTPFERVRQDLQDAIHECQRSLDWYFFIVEPRADRYRIPMDGHFALRRWWFVLREVS